MPGLAAEPVTVLRVRLGDEIDRFRNFLPGCLPVVPFESPDCPVDVSGGDLTEKKPLLCLADSIAEAAAFRWPVTLAWLVSISF
jgi:hypothetical protein